MLSSGTFNASTSVMNCSVSLSCSVAVISVLGMPVAATRMVAVPLVTSTSSAAARVTGWSISQFEGVKVKAAPDWTVMSVSPLIRETDTFTSAEG